MPTLDWIGKKAVVNHHREVPYRLIHCDKDKSHGDPDAGNLLVQGDNLEALKALLPYYAGKVKCIYIDPPYNTGNESWVYNDNVNSPEIRAWLGSVVGKEAEDLSRHDKWLCMMYPRLRLLKEFLSDDGSIWISIDDNEGHYLKTVVDEIFGRRGYVTSFIWQKVDSPNDNKVPITPDHEYILCYEKTPDSALFKKKGDESILDSYKSTEEEPRLHRDRLIKKNGANSLREDRPTMFFKIEAPDGTPVYPIHDDGREANWAFSIAGVERLRKEKRLVWKQRIKDGETVWIPYAREFAPSDPERPHPTILLDVKTSRQAKAHQRQLLENEEAFSTVKPEQLLQRILEIATQPGDIILDSFLGSGTTAAVAHKMERRWIGVEMGEHATTHCTPRMKKVIEGEQGGSSQQVNWQGGGGFRFCTLGEQLFDADGNVSPSVTFPDLAAHVFFCETGSPIPKRADGASPLIGTFQNRAIYMLHSAEAVGVAREQAGNVLTGAVLEALPLPDKDFAGARIVYAEGCTVPDDRLSALGVTFKQIPIRLRGFEAMALPVFSLKNYQLQTLASLRRFLEKTVELNDADTAFYALTKRPFFQPPGLPGLPYVCLRVPTGGGKTILAAHSIALAADAFLRCDNPTVLWLVPSDTIREQTLATLSNRAHPNRRALADRFGENVRVMTIQDALYAKRADYDGGAVVIVATIQAFRVEKTEGRKVYEANGELMDHFSGIASEQRAILEAGPSGDPLPSLANVLRMRRPMVIVDEAHNARTDLSFDTLARLSPSLIVELTATPVTPDEHKPEKGIYASNVLHHVSAAELKAEEMIKLPVILRGRADPRDTISDAMAWLDELSATARAEENITGEFVRPVMLLQAEPRSKDKPTLHADEVKKLLVEDFRVPEEHIVIATGDSKGLDGVDLFDRDCKVRFIITQQALKEGWDCSFAYVLCSVAEQKSARAVEQLLGRVLRLPHAKRKHHEDLNRAFAFATTTSFQNAASTLRDGLVNNGFERVEAQALVRAVAEPLHGLEPGGLAYVHEEAVPFELDFQAFEKNIHTLTGGRVELDPEKQVIRARGALTDYDRTALLLALPDAAAGMIDALVHKSRGARLNSTGEDKGPIRFAVPRLAVKTAHGLQLFDRGHFLDIPWKLENDDPAQIMDFFVPPRQARDEAHVDVDQAGHVNVEFVTDLHEQLMLNLQERGWTKNALVNWLDRRLPFTARRDITRISSTLFIAKALDLISVQTGMSLEALARAKFRLVEALVKVIAKHRDGRETQAFQQALIPQGGLDFKTSAELELVFEESRYAYREPYKGRTDFKKHLFRVIGDLEPTGEEHECAVYLERIPDVKAWVRNTSQQPNSFWLQTATDKFYPDFVALLSDGRILVVEYKGSYIASADDAKEKRLVGELWADRSGGSCIFVMVEGKEFGRIDAAIREGA